jgi:hypothetical protein
MKVEGSRPAGATPIRKDSKGGGRGEFADSLRTGASAAPAPVAAAAPPGGIEGLFALQEVSDPTADSQAAARGGEILDRLDELRRGLLLGQISPDRLAQLARLSRDASRQASDPRLKEVLDEIELRAEVELAKLQSPGT